MPIPGSMLEAIRSNAWAADSAYRSTAVPTMLSATELQMLEWLGRSLPFPERSCIVDAGSFLGGSTRALAEGLAANTRAGGCRIHAYDMFRVPNDQYSQNLIGRFSAGESCFDLFQKNLGTRANLVVPHPGDFMVAEPPHEEIGCLFVDIAKSWELNDVVIRRFFPHLIPGLSIVVQQDTNDHSCPWVNLAMEFFADYFEYLTDDSASRIFLYRKQIPQELLAVSLREDVLLDEKLKLMDDSARRAKSRDLAFLDRVSKGWVIFEFLGKQQALSYLEEIRDQQPWGDSPWWRAKKKEHYVDLVIPAMRALGDTAGFQQYLDGYFGVLHKAPSDGDGPASV